jgi:hypothetical protein
MPVVATKIGLPPTCLRTSTRQPHSTTQGNSNHNIDSIARLPNSGSRSFATVPSPTVQLRLDLRELGLLPLACWQTALLWETILWETILWETILWETILWETILWETILWALRNGTLDDTARRPSIQLICQRIKTNRRKSMPTTRPNYQSISLPGKPIF